MKVELPLSMVDGEVAAALRAVARQFRGMDGERTLFALAEYIEGRLREERRRQW